MNPRRLALIISLLLTLAMAACAPLSAAVPHESVAVPPSGDGAAGSGGGPVDTFSSSGVVANTTAPNASPADASAKTAQSAGATDRLVVKTATLSMVVNDPSDAVQKISTLATGMGGFVVSSSTTEASVDSQGNKIMQASLTVRVPSGQLDAALAQIRGMAVEVKSVNVTGQDVTAQYTDLQSQLNNAEAAEAKLQQIMDAATKTEDVMAVFNQLVAVRLQVEQLKGQIQYYQESAAMSAISLELIPNALNQPIEVGGWQPQGVAKDALESLVHAFQGLATGVIWIALYVLPLALVIGLPLYALVRLVVRRMRKPRAATA